jgi:hypothetical protein
MFQAAVLYASELKSKDCGEKEMRILYKMETVLLHKFVYM